MSCAQNAEHQVQKDTELEAIATLFSHLRLLPPSKGRFLILAIFGSQPLLNTAALHSFLKHGLGLISGFIRLSQSW
jgi:hypothetical protein